MGSPAADIVRNVVPEGSVYDVLVKLMGNGLASIVEWLSGNSGLPQDSVAALDVLTTQTA